MELKERIIKEATRMFVESGIKSVRMDDVATACGISKRTLYEIFEDREDFIRQSLCHNLEQQKNVLDTRLEHAANVLDEFKIIFDYGPELRKSIRNIAADLMKFYPEIFDEIMRSHHETVVSDTEQRLRRGIEQGLFLRSIDTEFVARSLMSYLFGLHQDMKSLATSNRLSDSNSELMLQSAIMYFLRGLTTEKGCRYMDENILKLTK